MESLSIWDLVLTPLYLFLLLYFGRRHRDKKYPKGHLLRKYYMPGLYAKFGGAIFIALIYEFYYGGGDTYFYFTHAKIINSSLSDSFDIWLKLIFRTPAENDPKLYEYTQELAFYTDPSSYTVASISAVLGLLCGTTYLPIALMFAYLTYSGIWAMYRTFVNLYPSLHKEFAIAFLFIPSTVVWGSAIFKDTVCMFGLGWMTYCTFRIFINRDFSFGNIFLLVVSFYLIATIKIYILLAFIPALSLWLLMSYSHKIKSPGIKFVVNLAFIGITIGGFFFFTAVFAEEMNRYSLENINRTADLTRQWIMYASGDEGSAYDIGEFDGTLGGMLSKFPAGVVVTLFRPFPWEIKKVIVGLSAIESLLFLYFTLKVIFQGKKGLGRVFKNPSVVFFFTFSIIFAFAVGITSGNFGALSRYKIPCLPFYAAFLFICLNYSKSLIQLKMFTPKAQAVPVTAS